MKKKTNHKIISKYKNPLIFLILGLAIAVTPQDFLEPALGIGLQKVLTIIFVVGLIQVLGILLLKKIPAQAGLLIHGFISGFLSSTALTLTLARKSKDNSEKRNSLESLSFLSGTAAMLIQAIILSYVTDYHLPISSLSVFAAPLIVTVILIIYRTIHTKDRKVPHEEVAIDWSSNLKLALFICLTLAVSSLAKKNLGDQGLQFLTFLVSLFEVHGSIVANTQLFLSEKIKLELYNTLLLLSIGASYVSKLGIVYFLGDSYLKKKVSIWSSLVLASMVATWLLMGK